LTFGELFLINTLKLKKKIGPSIEYLSEGSLCPDAWHPEYEGDKHTCSLTHDCEELLCHGCDAVWKDEPYD